MKTLFLGDISPTAISSPLFKEKNTGELFKDTVSVFNDKDFIFANLECALTDAVEQIKKFGPALKAPAETAAVLKDLGVNCLGLSNNHIFDFGIKGYEDTVATLNEYGIDFTGFGSDYENSRKNYIVKNTNEKICVIAVCEHEYSYALDDRMGSRPFDEFDTMEDIRNAKAENDRVIVLYHGAKEMCQYPSPRLIKVCRAMAKNGADVVLCQHSHCIGTYEKFHDCHILYGQGNFHFVLEKELDIWNTGFAVSYDTVSNEIEFIPVKIDGAGIALVTGAEKDELMAAFYKRGEELQNGEWKNGWHKFCVENTEKYVNSVKNALLDTSSEKDNQKFAHYLDCEAHTDVWRELFTTYNLTNEK